MGRWGDGIYESDQSLDFLHVTVTQKLARELVYLASPEQVKPASNWLYEVLSIIEIMLLFDVRQFDYELLVHLTVMPEIIQRTESITLDIWDAAWTTDEKFPFSDAQYRKQNRQILQTWFERLSVISDYYYGDEVIDDNGLLVDLAQFDPKVKIPYFSSIPDPFGLGSNITNRLLDDLIHIISFTLSDENRPNLESWFSKIDDVCVSVDVIGYLCKAFEISPKVSSRMVNIYQDKVTDVWQIAKNDDSFKETKSYKNVLVAFKQLNHVAEKYPPKWIK